MKYGEERLDIIKSKKRSDMINIMPGNNTPKPSCVGMMFRDNENNLYVYDGCAWVKLLDDDNKIPTVWELVKCILFHRKNFPYLLTKYWRLKGYRIYNK